MSYKYKENKIKSGRPRSKVMRETLPAISVDSGMKKEIVNAANKLGISTTEFRRKAYQILIKYADKILESRCK